MTQAQKTNTASSLSYADPSFQYLDLYVEIGDLVESRKVERGQGLKEEKRRNIFFRKHITVLLIFRDFHMINFDHIIFPLSILTLPRSTLHRPPLLAFFFQKYDSWSPIGVTHILIHWSVFDSPGAILLKKTDSPSLRSQQLSITLLS